MEETSFELLINNKISNFNLKTKFLPNVTARLNDPVVIPDNKNEILFLSQHISEVDEILFNYKNIKNFETKSGIKLNPKSKKIVGTFSALVPHKDPVTLVKTIKELKNYSRFDMVIDMQGLIKSAILSRLVGKNVYGFEILISPYLVAHLKLSLL